MHYISFLVNMAAININISADVCKTRGFKNNYEIYKNNHLKGNIKAGLLVKEKVRRELIENVQAPI